MSDDLSDLHPDTVNPATLVARLRGQYRIPINDGLGPVEGSEEPDNAQEYVRSYATPPIQRVAAAEIERLRAALDAAEKDNTNLSQQALALLSERDAALARADAAEHALNMERARVHECRTIQREMARDIQALQPPGDLAAQAPGDAVAKERESRVRVTEQNTADIVARLRDVAPGYGRLRLEAADEIERLRAIIRARAGA